MDTDMKTLLFENVDKLITHEHMEHIESFALLTLHN